MARVDIRVTAHAVERFRQRVYVDGSATYILHMVRNALDQGYEVQGDKLTFGIVTFVLKQRKRGFSVVTCYRAERIAPPAPAASGTGVRDG